MELAVRIWIRRRKFVKVKMDVSMLMKETCTSPVRGWSSESGCFQPVHLSSGTPSSLLPCVEPPTNYQRVSSWLFVDSISFCTPCHTYVRRAVRESGFAASITLCHVTTRSVVTLECLSPRAALEIDFFSLKMFHLMGVQESLLSVGAISPGTNQNLITYIFVHYSNAKHTIWKNYEDSHHYPTPTSSWSHTVCLFRD